MSLRSADEVPRRIADLGLNDAYVVLDVPPDASEELIQQGYRRAMVRAHPDRGGSAERAQLVNCAYDVLTRYREEYDRNRLRGGADDEDDEEPYEPPIRVQPEPPRVEEEEPPRRFPARRVAFVVGGLLVVAAGVLLGRQIDSPITRTAAQPSQLWTANHLAPSGTSANPSASPPDDPSASPGASGSLATAPGAHQCAVRPDGSLWCWGAGRHGQLGNGVLADSSEPVRVGSPADRWMTVSAGADSTCALQADAGLWCWGDNALGQLGDGTSIARSTPVRITAGGPTWLAVAVGRHTCAVRSDHTLWCWGGGGHGELGDDSTGRPLPGQVGPETTWAAVSVTPAGTCAVRQNGSRQCWGSADPAT